MAEATLTWQDLRGDRGRQRTERIVHGVMTAAAFASLVISALIVYSLLNEAWTFMTQVEWSAVLDAPGWFHTPESAPQLQALATAVWEDRIVRIRYDRGDRSVERELSPLDSTSAANWLDSIVSEASASSGSVRWASNWCHQATARWARGWPG